MDFTIFNYNTPILDDYIIPLVAEIVACIAELDIYFFVLVYFTFFSMSVSIIYRYIRII